MKVGEVTHYYDNIGVAIVKLKSALKVSDRVKFIGHGSDFEQTAESIQIDHKPVESAGAGKVVGLKTEQKVKVGTEVEKI
jgi:hypothetical protein